MKQYQQLLKVLLYSTVPLFVAILSCIAKRHGQPTADEIKNSLSDTVIPELHFSNTPYSEAVAAVLRYVSAKHPHLNNIQFISYFPKSEATPSPDNPYYSGRISLSFAHVPADEALRYIAGQTSLGYAVRDNSIYFYAIPANGEEPPLTLGDHLSSQIRRFKEGVLRSAE